MRPFMGLSGARFAVAGGGVPYAHGHLACRISEPQMFMLCQRLAEVLSAGGPAFSASGPLGCSCTTLRSAGSEGSRHEEIPEANSEFTKILSLLPTGGRNSEGI